MKKNNNVELRKENSQEKKCYEKPRFDTVQLIADQTLSGCNLLPNSTCDPFPRNS